MTLIRWTNGEPECMNCWNHTARRIKFLRALGTNTFRCPECGKEFTMEDEGIRPQFAQMRVAVDLGENSVCDGCKSRFCVCPERMKDGTWTDPHGWKDAVNHPSHYTQGKIECIDFIEDQKMGFHLGNAIKYIVRAPFKGTTKQDIEKAIWYLRRYLDTL